MVELRVSTGKSIFRAFAFRDIDADADQSGNFPFFIPERKFGREEPAFPSLLIKKVLFPVYYRSPRPQNELVVLKEVLGTLSRKECEVVLSEHFAFRGPPHVVNIGDVRQDLPTREVLDVDRIRKIVDQCAQKNPVVLDGLLGTLPVRDVPHDSIDPDDAAIGNDRHPSVFEAD